MSSIGDNYFRIQERVSRTTARSGRLFESVTLIVVTKKQPVEKIRQVIQAGANNLGENYPEETDQKINNLDMAARITWHMIGHIQSRKIKYLVKDFSWIHSIDRMETAEKLSSVCMSANIKLQVLIEVNIASEATKYGFNTGNHDSESLLIDNIGKMTNFNGIELRGIMCMPPISADLEESRGYFIRSRELLINIQKQLGLEKFNQLSMGTSSDFEVAIEEGATFVRIGEAIMGARNYQ